MHTIEINSWDKFLEEIRKIRERYEYTTLFRGQANSEWPLQTTLERKTNEKINVLKYMRYATSNIKELESFTGKNWNIST